METHYDNYLSHHGIKGQKWGVRRFQNADGSVTAAGKARYYQDRVGEYTKAYNKASNHSDRITDMQNEEESLWKEAKEKRKALGKNPFSRTINAIKGTSKEAKEYSKAYNRASDYSDKITDMKAENEILWKEADAKYKATGKNAVSRILNNIKYDTSNSRKRNSINRYDLSSNNAAMNVAKRQTNRKRNLNAFETANKKRGNF